MSSGPGDDASERASSRVSDVGTGGLLRHARNYLSAGAIAAVASVVTVPVLTRLLSVEEYGVLSIFMSMVSVLAIVLGLNLHGALSRYYLEHTDDFPDYLRTTLSFLGLVIVAELVIALVLRDWFGALFEVPGALFMAAVLMSASLVVWNMHWKLLVARMHSGPYARLKAIKAVAEPVVGIACIVGLLVWQTGSVTLASEREAQPVGLYWGQIGGLLLVGFTFAAILGRRMWRLAGSGRFERSHLRYALGFGVPLMPHALSGYILNLFDVIIINMVVGARSAGLYAFAYTIGSIMNTVVGSVNQAWQPVFTDHRTRERYDKIANLAAGQARYVYCAAIGIVLFAEEIAFVLADHRYHAALPLVPVVVFGYVALFLYTLYANHSFYLRRTGLVSLATVIAGVANIGLNFWLIPHYGIAAAAWTTLASYLILLVMHFIIARFVLREQVVPLARVAPGYLLAGAVAGAYVLGAMAIEGYWLRFLLLKLPIAAAVVFIIWRGRRADREAEVEPQ